MIVFGAIVPHSPLLIPAIGKEHYSKLSATAAAIQEIEQALYVARPDTICMIAPHGIRYPDAFSINLAAKYLGTLKTFGDHSTSVTAKSDYLLIDRLQRKLRGEHVPFTLTSSEELDYGFTIPLLLLTTHLQHWKIIPVSPSMLDGSAHYEFGKQLKRVLHAESERVAVIASVDLSHKATSDSPEGVAPEGQLFDQTVRDALAAMDPAPLLHLDASVIERAEQCAYRPLATLFGAIEGLNVHPTTLSYEAPFGVGYVTAKFEVV
jgi:aromatic ring-opening dioxygenase LigB subunit